MNRQEVKSGRLDPDPNQNPGVIDRELWVQGQRTRRQKYTLSVTALPCLNQP